MLPRPFARSLAALRHSLLWAGTSLTCLALAPAQDIDPAAEQEPAGAVVGPDFVSEVLPILEARCAECHGTHLRRPKGRLKLTRAGLLTGGVGGAALIPGDPDASLMIQGVQFTHEWLEMPPEEKLPEAEIDTLVRWVAAGADWPQGREVVWRDPATEPALAGAAAEPPTFSAEDLAYFEREVRPLLAANCFDCHGVDVERPKAGLVMSGHAALLRGGESGPAIVAGAPHASRLVQAVRYDGELKMPPLGRLSDAEISVLEQWVARGAPWPPEREIASHGDTEDHLDIEAGRERWAFRAVAPQAVPEVEHAELVDSPIDAFIIARLESSDLAPAPLATPRELYRRLSFDLVGLPPTLEEVRAFESAYRRDSSAAFAGAVDELLARPEYGERWARHWLDVVRFAQTNAFERDSEKPFAWRYRDWVVDALNADQPYDDFLRYQLAGDEIEAASADGLIATGFYRLGTWDDEPADPIEAEFDELDDVLRTITEGMLGVTIGCARCHDHRFDPFLQEDYYSLLAFVRGVERYAEPEFSFSSSTLRPIDDSPLAIELWRKEQGAAKRALQAELKAIMADGRQEALQARMAQLPAPVQAAFAKAPEERTPEDVALLRSSAGLRPTQEEAVAALTPEARLRSRSIATELQAEGTSTPGSLSWALSVRESSPAPPATHLLLRGRAATPGPEVEPRFPAVLLPASKATAPPPSALAREASSGRRSVLADWITDPRHPLTARVIVNRVWQHHFGRGIVATPNDFGSTGIAPTHPELLDWLAADFVAHDWSLKHLHRTILKSRTWRQSSRVATAAGMELDPAGELLWRQRPRRLEAEALRDALFAVSDSLNPERGGRGFFPAISREALAGMSKPGLGWEPSNAEQRARRALYAFSMRGLPVPFLQLFDAPSNTLPVGARQTTTLATQALTLLNSELVGDAARRLAERVQKETGDDVEAQVRRVFERTLARAPQQPELDLAAEFLVAQRESFATEVPRSTFRPRVPERLEVRFHAKLNGADMLQGPREHWSYHTGRWGGGYNGTVEWDPELGPFALARHTTLPAGPVGLETSVTIERGSQLAFLLGAAPDGASRVELRFNADDGSIALLSADGSALAGAARSFEPGKAFALRIAAHARTFQVALDGEMLLEAPLAGFPWQGHPLGLRVRGDAVHLRDLTLSYGGERHTFADPVLAANLRALASLSLVLLNHNEFAYVD